MASTGGSSPGTSINLGSPTSTVTSASKEPYDPRRAEDAARRYIAYALIGITAGIIVGAFILAAWALSPNASIADNLDTILALLNVVFGPVIALLGSATGFYFGANTARRASEDRAGGATG